MRCTAFASVVSLCVIFCGVGGESSLDASSRRGQGGGDFHVTVPHDHTRSVHVTIAREEVVKDKERDAPDDDDDDDDDKPRAPVSIVDVEDPVKRERITRLRRAAVRRAACDDLRRRWSRCFGTHLAGTRALSPLSSLSSSSSVLLSHRGGDDLDSSRVSTSAGEKLPSSCAVHKRAYCLCCQCCFHFDVHEAHKPPSVRTRGKSKTGARGKRAPYVRDDARLARIEAEARAESDKVAAKKACDDYNDEQKTERRVEKAQLYQVSEQCFYCFALAVHVQRVMGVMPVSSWKMSKLAEIAQICTVTALAAPFVPNPFLPGPPEPISRNPILDAMPPDTGKPLPIPPNPALAAVKLMGMDPSKKITKCIGIGTMLVGDMSKMYAIAPMLTPQMGNAWMLARSAPVCEEICVMRRAVVFIMSFLGKGSEKPPPPPPPPPGCEISDAARPKAAVDAGGEKSAAARKEMRKYVWTMGESYVESTIHRAFGHVHEDDRAGEHTGKHTIGLEMDKMVDAFRGPGIKRDDLFLAAGHVCRETNDCKDDAQWDSRLRQVDSGGASRVVPGVPGVTVYVGGHFVRWSLAEEFAHLYGDIPRRVMIDTMAGSPSNEIREEYFLAVGDVVRTDQNAELDMEYWDGAPMKKGVAGKWPSIDALYTRIGKRFVDLTIERNFAQPIRDGRHTHDDFVRAMAGGLPEKIFYKHTGIACVADKQFGFDRDDLWRSFHRDHKGNIIPGPDGARYLLHPNRYYNPMGGKRGIVPPPSPPPKGEGGRSGRTSPNH